MKRLITLVALYFASTFTLYAQSPDDSGMWLLPQIKGMVHAEMAKKGLLVPPEKFYSPDAPSLNQSIVRINVGQGGGGTGSFVSPNGLILTNHHVAYDAIASASSADVNYLKDGFMATSLEEEVVAQNYSLYIPIEQIDVTETIAQRVEEYKGQVEEQAVRAEMIQEKQDGNNDLVVEIDDYWEGNRQYMVVYQVVRDVRIVFAPPSSIGKFGGDIDNWMWPRHTGDFTYLRGYVAPDGSAAEYDSSNVPFTPDYYLPVSVDGVEKNDFTMTMGFPGSTYRFESSYAFEFYELHRNPYIIAAFQAVLDGLEYAAEQDEQVAVENASDRASVANTLKYFQGIQKGFKDYSITKKRRQEEARFAAWIAEDTSRTSAYGAILPTLEEGYGIASQYGDVLYASIYTLNNSALIQLSSLFKPIVEFAASEQDSLEYFPEAQIDSVFKQVLEVRDELNLEAELLTLDQLLLMLATMPDDKRPGVVDEVLALSSHPTPSDAVDAFMSSIAETSLLLNLEKARGLMETPKDSLANALEAQKTPLLTLFDGLSMAFAEARQGYSSHFGVVRPVKPLYVKAMMEFQNKPINYADANFTLRLSGGRVLGYKPADGVYYTPETTLQGVLAKHQNEEPFDVPDTLFSWVKHVEMNALPLSKYANEEGNLIVNFLSTNDITGGNSGSPVLNGNGEMVGIAFDGNIEGVPADYYFDPELNRCISVDMRYVLFLTEEIYGLDRLIEEMQIIRTLK